MNSIAAHIDEILGMPRDVSGQGAGVDSLIFWVHLLMAVLFVGWIAYFFLVLLKFNNRANPKADYVGVRGHTSTYAEILVAVIEGVLLVGLAIPLWAHAVDEFPKGKDVTTIHVIAQQFNWNAIYPGTNGIFAAQDVKFASSDNPFGLDKKDPNFKSNFSVSKDLEVPVDKPVVAYISSMDVIHCFTIKVMRVTQDAIPGMRIPAWFTPKVIGTYQINCAQLCGNGHYAMRGNLKVVSQADYDAWVTKKSNSGGGAGAGYE
jgi:cytochrome c oxidase subunit 2